MELICPECRAGLVIADGQNATCAAHDGRYQILFDRSADPEMPAVTTAAPSYPPVVRPALDITCQQHPDVQALTRCRICLKGVCAVCEFILPGDVRVCPACLEREPPTEISANRRLAMGIALFLAGFGSLMIVLARSGAFMRTFGHTRGADVLLGLLVLWPSLAGLTVALSAHDQRLQNSRGIWIAIVWNGINFGIFVIFRIIGLAGR